MPPNQKVNKAEDLTYLSTHIALNDDLESTWKMAVASSTESFRLLAVEWETKCTWPKLTLISRVTPYRSYLFTNYPFLLTENDFWQVDEMSGLEVPMVLACPQVMLLLPS